MKKCRYCGSEADDQAALCKSCGSHEFDSICSCCGTVISAGMYCPMCGTRVGTRPKTCPRCAERYRSAACPECGYTESQAAGSRAADKPEPRRRTWLWVLGWIFIFPVPATILALHSARLSGRTKAAVIALVWLIYLLIGFSGS